MATKNFRSTVLEPTSEFAYGDKLRFTALATTGEVLKGSFSETTIGEDGVYSVDLQYGKHRIDYKPYEGVWRHFADVEVNADTLATTLQDLALSSVPVTDETILVLQGILADAEAAKTAAESAETAAETALASIDSKIAEVEAGYPSLLAAQMSKTFYLNAETGDDSNDGLTAGTAVKTIASLQNRVISGAKHTFMFARGDYEISGQSVFDNCDLTLTGSSDVYSLVTSGAEVTASNAARIIVKKSSSSSSRIRGTRITIYNMYVTNDLNDGEFTGNASDAFANGCLMSEKLLIANSCYHSKDANIALFSKAGGTALVDFSCDRLAISGKVDYLIKGHTTVKCSVALSTVSVAGLSTNSSGAATEIVLSSGFQQVIGS